VAIATNLKNNDALAWTSQNSTIALSGTLTNSGSLGWTSDANAILINVNVASAVDNIALAWTSANDTIAITNNLLDSGVLGWTDSNSTVALAGNLTDGLLLSWTDQSAIALTGNVASTSADAILSWTDSSTIALTGSVDTPASTVSTIGGGIYYQDQKRRKRGKGQLDKILDDSIIEYQQQLKGFANRDIPAVKEIVKPFIQQETVDYVSLQADIDAIRALMIEYQKYLIRKDEEELLILLLG
jgi:hypothetical protein